MELKNDPSITKEEKEAISYQRDPLVPEIYFTELKKDPLISENGLKIIDY
jgi:hypothetical protein